MGVCVHVCVCVLQQLAVQLYYVVCGCVTTRLESGFFFTL